MDVKSSRVVVTGGAGFIGSHLVDLLLKHGNEVIVVDDFSTGNPGNLEQHRTDPRLHIERVSILDYAVLRSAFKGAHFVFHLATRNVRLSLRQPTVVHEVNTTGTLNVLKAAAAARVQRLLYCSSSEVNGTADRVPMAELYCYRPETIYGASKLTGEYYTQVFQRAGWLQTVIARPFNNYGPREHYSGPNGEVIPRFILWALAGKPLLVYGDGLQSRDFTYVTETVHYLKKLAECEEAAGGLVNVCRGEEVSVLHLAQSIRGLVGNNVPIIHKTGRPSDVLRLHGDPALLKRTLGSSPTISIAEGLKETVNWFRCHVPITDEVLRSLNSENWSVLSAEEWLEPVLSGRQPSAAA